MTATKIPMQTVIFQNDLKIEFFYKPSKDTFSCQVRCGKRLLATGSGTTKVQAIKIAMGKVMREAIDEKYDLTLISNYNTRTFNRNGSEK